MVNRAALRLANGDLEGAESLYREAIDLDPGNATAHANLGYLLAATGRHSEAVEHAEQAIALEPRRSAPWAHLGMSQVALGHVNAGLSSLGHAVRLDPANHSRGTGWPGCCLRSAGPRRRSTPGGRRYAHVPTTLT